jgi:hypothetical protein
MPRQKLTADFMLTAFELANDAPAKINFLVVLGEAVAKRPKLAEAGYPAALAAASDESREIRQAAYEALYFIFKKRPLLADASAIQMLARACVYDEGLEDKVHEATISVSDNNQGWPTAAMPVFIEAMDDTDTPRRKSAYQHFSYIVVKHTELAERTLPIARAHLTDANDRIRYMALMDVDHIMQKRPELADESLLLQVATMAAKDAHAALRKEAAEVMSDFSRKHSRRADDLQPNKRLLRVTARLQAIVLAVAGR